MSKIVLQLIILVFVADIAYAEKCKSAFDLALSKTELAKIKLEKEDDFQNLLNEKNLAPLINSLEELRKFVGSTFSWPEKLEVTFSTAGAYHFEASPGELTVVFRDGSNQNPLYSEKKLSPPMLRAIFLHEAVHTLYFQKMADVFKEYQPVYKKKLKTGDLQGFHDLETLSIPYQELVADLIAAAMHRDPKIMASSLANLNVNSSKIRSFTNRVPIEGWSQAAMEDMITISGKEFAITEHLVFVPIRKIIWQKFIEPSFKQGNTAEVIKAVVDASLQEIAWHYGKVDPSSISNRRFYELNLEEMNTRLLDAIKSALDQSNL